MTIAVRGKPADPVIGPTRIVIYEMRWVLWAQLVLGAGVVVMGLAALLGWTDPNSKYGPVLFLGIPIGPLMMADAWRKLRRWPCLIVGESGFDDRMGDNPAGSVLWSEVLAMRLGARGGLATWEVQLGPLPRIPLSPLGNTPHQITQVVIKMTLSERKKIPVAMESAYRSWHEAQEYGF